jgi:2,3-bisphosphoglycerate-dependent phosphoglycerate mutase
MHECIIYLIRHGQTSWNAERRLQGQIDIPLNEAGIAEAHLLAEEFQHHPIAAVYSSPLVRAHETARILNLHHRHDIQIRHDLKEAAYGSLEGFKRDDYAERLAEFAILDKQERITFKFSHDSESYLEVYERARPVLDEIILNHPGEHVVVVAHGGLMRAVAAIVTGCDVRNVSIQNIGYLKLIGDGVKITLQHHKRVEL